MPADDQLVARTQLTVDIESRAMTYDGGGRMVLAVDVGAWLRSDPPTSPQRGRGKNQAQLIPAWLYSFVAALETGPNSWTSVLDAVRSHPDDYETPLTATQVREVITRLREAGHHRDGDPYIPLMRAAGTLVGGRHAVAWGATLRQHLSTFLHDSCRHANPRAIFRLTGRCNRLDNLLGRHH